MSTKIIPVLLLLSLGAFLIPAKTEPDAISVSCQPSNIIPNEKQTEQDSLREWIDKLEKYENCPPEGIVDKNGYMSRGGLCFQMTTFKFYTQKYYPESKEWENEDWLNNIMDTEFQKELAYKMISENKKEVWHWRTSIERGLGIP